MAAGIDITTDVIKNDRGTEDVQIRAGGRDGRQLAKDIEAAFNEALKRQMLRREFSGQLEILVLGTTPIPERRYLPPMIDRLRAICAELATAEGPYKVTLTYQAQVSKKGRDAATAIAAATQSAPPAAPDEPVSAARKWTLIGAGVAIVAVLGGAGWWIFGSSLPRAVDLGQQHFTIAGDRSHDSVDAGLYTLARQPLAEAQQRVGVYMSTVRKDPPAMLAWLHDEYGAGVGTMYEAVNGVEACRINDLPAGPGARLSFQLCAVGSRRIVCVTSDENLPRAAMANCQTETSPEQKSACFDSFCRQRRAGRLALLQKLADSLK